jgi:hypothetical protein
MKWFGKRSSLNFYTVALVFFVTIINVFFSFHNQAFHQNRFTYQEHTSSDFSVISDLLEDEDETFTEEDACAGGNLVYFAHEVVSLDPHLHHWVFSPFIKDGKQTVPHRLFLRLRKLII